MSIKRGVKNNLDLRRRFRKEMTPAEEQLWFKLNRKQLLGVKFRRQHGIGPYIVDFYCPEKALIVEVDGDVHAFENNLEKDKLRQNYLENLGLRVVRYQNNDILKSLESVLEDLCQKVENLPPPAPSLQRRGKI